jgi:Ca2+-binding RTX toxin-like protein
MTTYTFDGQTTQVQAFNPATDVLDFDFDIRNVRVVVDTSGPMETQTATFVNVATGATFTLSGTVFDQLRPANFVDGTVVFGDATSIIQVGSNDGASLTATNFPPASDAFLAFGMGGNDTITGGTAYNYLNGGQGADDLIVEGGVGSGGTSIGADQLLQGGQGADDIFVGRGTGLDADTFASGIRIDIFGNKDADTITVGGDDAVLAGAAVELNIEGDSQFVDGATDIITVNGGNGAGASFGGFVVNINGNKGDDTIDGGAGGDDWLVGGQGNDLITAHAGGNILYGNIGNDTLNGGSGSEIIRGGQNDDVIYGGGGNDWLSGDRGNDTLTGGAGADIFHSFAAAGLDRVLDFNLAEGDRVQLDPGTAYALAQAGADTVIDMGGGNQMVLAGVTLATLPTGWIFEA